MTGRNVYILSFLPSLEELGSAPPMTPREFLDLLEENPRPHAAAAAMFLSDDLLMRDSRMAGSKSEDNPTVLTEEQISGDAPLPEYLCPEESQPTPGRTPEEVVWEDYFRYCEQTARKNSNGFLSQWTRNEVALRNALALARAAALNIEGRECTVAEDICEDADDFDHLVAQWSAAMNPLEGMRVLDRFRKRWTDENSKWFSFQDDELAGYASNLMLLHRWHRTNRENTEVASTKK